MPEFIPTPGWTKSHGVGEGRKDGRLENVHLPPAYSLMLEVPQKCAKLSFEQGQFKGSMAERDSPLTQSLDQAKEWDGGYQVPEQGRGPRSCRGCGDRREGVPNKLPSSQVS